MKKIVLLCTLVFSLVTISAHASEFEEEIEGPQQTVTAITTDGKTRVSWGEGLLEHANPLGRKPWAYAKTKTFAGTAYSIKAKTTVKSGGYTDSTSWATRSNASSATSATIIARTESGVSFTGNHEIKDTSTSGWQNTTTLAKY